MHTGEIVPYTSTISTEWLLCCLHPNTFAWIVHDSIKHLCAPPIQ